MEDINFESQQVLSELLNESRDQYDIRYGESKNKFNHLPLALVELAGLGASPDRLREFYNLHKAKLDTKLPSTGFITKHTWKKELGHQMFWNDYRDFFTRELDSKRASYEQKFPGQAYRGLIAEYFPKLMSGLAGGEFHSLMLLGCALDRNDQAFAIDGLSYLCFTHLPLGADQIKLSASKDSSITDFLEVLKKVVMEHQRRDEYKNGDLSSRLHLLADKEKGVLDRYETMLHIDHNNWEQVVNRGIDIFVHLYSGCFDESLLHVAAGGIALRQIIPLLNPENQLAAAHFFLRACLGVYIVTDQKALQSADPSKFDKELKSIRWNDITQKAVQCDNEHAIKFAYLLWCEDNHRFNIMHKFVASMLVGLINKKQIQKKKLFVGINEMANKPSYARAVLSQPPQAVQEAKKKEKQSQKGQSFAFMSNVESKMEEPIEAEPQKPHFSYAEALKQNETPEQMEAETREVDLRAEMRGEPIPSPIAHKLEKQGELHEPEPQPQPSQEHKRHEEQEPSEEGLPHKKMKTPRERAAPTPAPAVQIAVVLETVQTVVDTSQQMKEQATEKLKDIQEQYGPTLAQATQTVKDFAQDKVEQARDKAQDTLSQATQTVKEYAQQYGPAISQAKDVAQDTIAQVTQKAKDITQDTIAQATQKAKDITQDTLAQATQKAKDLSQDALEMKKKAQSVVSNLPQTIDRSREVLVEKTHKAFDVASNVIDKSQKMAMDTKDKIAQTTANSINTTRQQVKQRAADLIDKSSSTLSKAADRVGLPPDELKPKAQHFRHTVGDIFSNLFSLATLVFFIMLPLRIYYNLCMIPFRAFNVLLLRPAKSRAMPVVRRLHNQIAMEDAREQFRQLPKQVKANISEARPATVSVSAVVATEEIPLQRKGTRAGRQQGKFYAASMEAKVPASDSSAEAILQNIEQLKQQVHQLETPASAPIRQG